MCFDEKRKKNLDTSESYGDLLFDFCKTLELAACEPVILIGRCLTDKTNKLSEHVFIHLLVDVPQGFTLGPLLYLISTFVITFLFMKIS